MSNSSTLLNGKKVIVIGGSSGMGRAVAAAALSNGASVVIASSSQAKVEKALELLKTGISNKDNVTATGQALSITDFTALAKFLTKEAPFDHFVCTAGPAPQKMTSDFAPDADIGEELKSNMDTRYWAMLNAANYIHKNNLIRPGGSFTMTAGVAQARPFAGWGFFVGALGAVETATRGLAVDLKPIRFNTISPGLVNTELMQEFDGGAGVAILEAHGKKLPVGHIGTPEEIAEAFIFAMKVILVDGGGILI
ncbi:Enoyl-(Acyl carrier protein) reductase [Ceratobasidium sp. AG-Ba]|nr:Enoyl-(Acyl carrier protein) reductase [Ceratobasidium sp. AG-Ba]